MSALEEMNISATDIQSLSAADQREVQAFLQQKSQEADIQRTVHEYTETCFKKCVKGNVATGSLNSKESGCVTNCVNRFLDSNLSILSQFQKMNGL